MSVCVFNDPVWVFQAGHRFKLSNRQLIRLLLIQSTTPSCWTALTFVLVVWIKRLTGKESWGQSQQSLAARNFIMQKSRWINGGGKRRRLRIVRESRERKMASLRTRETCWDKNSSRESEISIIHVWGSLILDQCRRLFESILSVTNRAEVSSFRRCWKMMKADCLKTFLWGHTPSGAALAGIGRPSVMSSCHHAHCCFTEEQKEN